MKAYKPWPVLQAGVIYDVYHWIAQLIPKIQLKTRNPPTEAEKEELAKLLASGYYIILTGNSYHLSSVLVKVMTFFKLGKWPKYSHVLMNVDFIDDPQKRDGFKFMEATVAGVHYSTFDQVFDCDTYCLLTPKYVDNERYTEIIDNLIKFNGRPYDDLFDLADQSKMSCVELIRAAFQPFMWYEPAFRNFEAMIKQEKNLMPQMFRECEDFVVKKERA